MGAGGWEWERGSKILVHQQDAHIFSGKVVENP